ncbi:uncharacterized protein PAC_14252 [Phialocephala subalpina]|uniref:F-box domain-containing protein n=1 Tax=Phialocephala subalpina TaxID=576137 RepID=A0A1L7XH46_9HELO|nr:uncharacterized protein PAC_14252 [Phialocephala subalpina]
MVPQSFDITVPERREFILGGSYNELLFQRPVSLVELLVVPVPPPPPSHVEKNKGKSSIAPFPASNAPARGGRKPGRHVVELAHDAHLAKLPTELCDFVFQNLSIRDVLHLSLTNRMFWEIGRKYLQAFARSRLGIWAGKNIVCVGTYLARNYYPRGLFNEHDKAEFLKERDPFGQPIHTLSTFTRRREGGSRRLDTYQRTPLHMLLQSPTVERTFSRMAEGDRMKIQHTLGFSQFYGSDESWILRNLTTKEFVRSEAIAIKPEYIHGPYIEYLGFGEVILSRICWSSTAILDIRYRGPINRGVWAGHSFDITTLDRHKEKATVAKEEWKDISEEVSKEVAEIWASEWGENWRESPVINTQRSWNIRENFFHASSIM